MSLFQDNVGTVFSTNHGQAPVGPQQVTTWNNGVAGSGFFNGTQVIHNR